MPGWLWGWGSGTWRSAARHRSGGLSHRGRGHLESACALPLGDALRAACACAGRRERRERGGRAAHRRAHPRGVCRARLQGVRPCTRHAPPLPSAAGRMLAHSPKRTLTRCRGVVVARARAPCCRDREFAGFGGPTEAYSDALLDAGALPVLAIQVIHTTRHHAPRHASRALPLSPAQASERAPSWRALFARCGRWQWRNWSRWCLQGASWVVTGTLGLAYPGSRAAMLRAVELAKQAGAKVRRWQQRRAALPSPSVPLVVALRC